ncbi:S-layer homology domain-containing protein [Paenibacillus cremeus]|uniref:S-layer homology domain-containing protein n=1 Tax=Paenibacillus cremeus TaxID=2163881 RepID=A0A559KD27_9BACL|nr:S-layer homology domain-containing protein [Paenibacillus cremeus]TVY10014.1 S-layer homology domain-containing protein [Paenibacillus cremeus]
MGRVSTRGAVLARKVAGTIMACLLVFGNTIPTGAAQAQEQQKRFSDVKGHWAEATIYRLVDQGILDGFPDGTFRPNDPVTADQFVKMLLLSYSKMYPNGERAWKSEFTSALSAANRSILQQDYRDFNFKASLSGYWAKPFIDLASDLHFINKSQFADFKTNLKREQVSEIVYYTVKETEYLEDEPLSMKSAAKLGDFLSAKAREQRFVAEAFGKGIMEGYPNGYFGIGQEVTRAESLAILDRITDKSKRVATAVTETQPELQVIVPTKDGHYKKVVFANAKMASAYTVLSEAAKLRGTNYDLVETTAKLYRDGDTKAKDLSRTVPSSESLEEASLWIEPEYRTYGITLHVGDGVLARNQEAVEKYANALFGYDALKFKQLYTGVYGMVEAGSAVENQTVAIGSYSVEVHVEKAANSVLFSILEKM